jgi:hypothetical protein
MDATFGGVVLETESWGKRNRGKKYVLIELRMKQRNRSDADRTLLHGTEVNLEL